MRSPRRVKIAVRVPRADPADQRPARLAARPSGHFDTVRIGPERLHRVEVDAMPGKVRGALARVAFERHGG